MMRDILGRRKDRQHDQQGNGEACTATKFHGHPPHEFTGGHVTTEKRSTGREKEDTDHGCKNLQGYVVD